MNSIKVNIESEVALYLIDINCCRKDELEDPFFLTSTEQTVLSKIGNEIRKLHYAMTRKFIYDLYKQTGILQIAPSGKPYLKCGGFISISHTKNLLGICLAPFEIGFDIEQPHHRLEKVKDKFLNEKDKSLKENLSYEDLSYLWNLKESAIKYVGDKRLSYKNQILIKECDFVKTASLEINLDNSIKKLMGRLIKFKNHTGSIVF